MPEPDRSLSFQEFCVRLGIPPGCISESTVASEHGRKFRIDRRPGDKVWRVQVDHCWLDDHDGAKTDYLFWCQSASGQKQIILVELKGRDFSHALEQIEAMLARLCQKSAVNLVHRRADLRASPGHDLTSAGGIKACVVLSKGDEFQYNNVKIARIRKRYQVNVYRKSICYETGLPLREEKVK